MTLHRIHRGTFADLARDERGRLVQCSHHYLDEATGKIHQYREERVYFLLPGATDLMPAWRDALAAEKEAAP